MGTKTPPSTPPHYSHDAISQLSNVFETPHDRKRYTAFRYIDRNKKADTSRSVTMADLGPAIPEMPFEFFKDCILPPLHPSICLPHVLKSLRTAGNINSDGRWQMFSYDPANFADTTKSRVDQKKTETSVFSHMGELIECLRQQSGVLSTDTLPSLIEYESKPNHVPIGREGIHTKPDGYMLFKTHTHHPGGRRYWRDLATPAEYKLQDRKVDLRDDVSKICWSMFQIMLEDPRRRFVFAFTIENTTMRIWTANRSGIIVSRPFNFVLDHEKVAYFFLSQLYAEAHELGVDTTMIPLDIENADEGPLTYDITVRAVSYSDELGTTDREDVVFRTTELINDDGAAAFRSRGTRVWDVQRMKDGQAVLGATGVLKDSWVDESREREETILRKIKYDSGLIEQDDQDLLNDLFLTPIASGDVYIGDVADKTPLISPGSSPCFLLEVPDGQNARPYVTLPSELLNFSASQHAAPVYFHSKSHYRIVFLERCKSLYKEPSLYRVFTHLMRATDALALMHRIDDGWVHRDVSPGNILTAQNSTKLSDLEYAKRLDDDKVHDIKTGTPNFMAVEVDQRTYLFKPSPPTSSKVTSSSLLPSRRQLHRMVDDQDIDEIPTVVDLPHDTKLDGGHDTQVVSPFRYNPLHDLESIWWLAIYFVVNHEARYISGPEFQPVTPEQRILARRLFYSQSSRNSALVGTLLDDSVAALSPCIQHVARILLRLKSELVSCYKDCERTLPKQLNKSAWQSIHDVFVNHFIFILKFLKSCNVMIQRFRPEPIEQQTQTQEDEGSGGLTTVNPEESVAQVGTKRNPAGGGLVPDSKKPRFEEGSTEAIV